MTRPCKSLRAISAVYIALVVIWIMAFVLFASTSGFKTELQNHPPTGLKHQTPTAIVVGLPKSGTTSLYHYFQCNSFDTTHYCCCGSTDTQYPCADGSFMSHKLLENLQNARPLLFGISGEVHAQLDGELFDNDQQPYFLPQHFYLDELHKAAPHAVWVLPLRSAEGWKRSVQEWLDMGDRIQTTYRYFHASGTKPTSASVLEGDFLVNFYNEHTKTVRAACQKYRRTCVEVTVNDSAGSTLAKAFPGTKASCWGRHNAGPFIQIVPTP